MGWQRTHSKSAGGSFHDLVCRLADWSLVYGLFLLSVISSTAGDSNTTTSGTATTVATTSSDDVQQEKSSSSVDPAILVVSITFPVGILVGVLWCYCMTAVFKIRTRDQGKKPSVNGMAEHNQRHYHESRDHHHHHHHHQHHHDSHHRERSPSPLSSSASSSPSVSRSPSPLALPPDIP